jgi:hypothetical protein
MLVKVREWVTTMSKTDRRLTDALALVLTKVIRNKVNKYSFRAQLGNHPNSFISNLVAFSTQPLQNCKFLMQSALSSQWKKEGIFRVRETLQIPTCNLKESSASPILGG